MGARRQIGRLVWESKPGMSAFDLSDGGEMEQVAGLRRSSAWGMRMNWMSGVEENKEPMIIPTCLAEELSEWRCHYLKCEDRGWIRLGLTMKSCLDIYVCEVNSWVCEPGDLRKARDMRFT